MLKSLERRKSELAKKEHQLQILNGELFSNELPRFAHKLKSENLGVLKTNELEILQLNLGYMCNQVCEHCHVDAGPDRKEIMNRETMEMCLSFLEDSNVKTLDLTGGAPEMNPDFRWFVKELNALGIEEIIVRSNLTIIMAHDKYRDLPSFFAENNVHVVSSLPCYTESNTDAQRGDGVFNKSIEALRLLNQVGYGSSDLQLDLVYNPGGAFLSGDQAKLEVDYKRELKEKFDIEFSSLFTINNLPISRFLDYLLKTEKYEEYMKVLVDNFNPTTVSSVMCKNTLSVGWDGKLFDCDFNQMLALGVEDMKPHISQVSSSDFENRKIVVSQHCYGCTAGAGSSCQGALS